MSEGLYRELYHISRHSPFISVIETVKGVLYSFVTPFSIIVDQLG